MLCEQTANNFDCMLAAQEAATDSAHVEVEAQRGRTQQPSSNGHVGPTDAVSAAANGMGVSSRPPAGDASPNGAAAEVQSSLAAATVEDSAEQTEASAAGGVHNDMPLDFRIVTEPVGLQPASALYGVPYDLVDQSAGSALAELMRLTQ